MARFNLLILANMPEKAYLKTLGSSLLWFPLSTPYGSW